MTSTPVQTEVSDVTTIGPDDVCDSHMLAPALVRVQLATGFQLLFCGHCYAKHEDALALKGVTVLEDIRATVK